MKFFVFSVLLLALIAVQTADARGRFGTRVATDGSDETDDGKDEKCDPSEVCREFRETGKFPGCPEAKTCAARYSDPCRPILCDGAGTFVCTDLVVKPSELKKSSFKRASSRRNRRNYRG
ncbi:hypothetical protein M3Y99_00247400 [Aphelenchoides fujianensis]|nr:hypothetical protein M3Y99_00247400 [Aphelenchoides fujianensis]